MTEFLFGQLDYAYFASGMGLVLWALGCFMLVRAHQRLLPWRWLGYFALLQGVNDWISLILHVFGLHHTTCLLSVFIKTLSYGFLWEFIRVGVEDWRLSRLSRWLLPCVLVLGLLGAFWGLEGLERSVYYGLVLTAGLGAGLLIWQSIAKLGWGGGHLKITSLALAAYTLTFGFNFPTGCSFPAHLPTLDYFTNYTGIPLQVLRTLIVWLAAIPLWLFGRRFNPEEMDRFNLRVRRRLTWGMAFTTVLLLVLGWLITQFFGAQARQEAWTVTQQSSRQFHYLLANEMSEIHSIARAVAGTPSIARCLQSSDGEALKKCNSVVDLYSLSFQETVVYLMNLQGITVASSNRDRPDSFVGKSYIFRPYFQQARAGGYGQYLALGFTSQERGFYASAPIYEAGGAIVGVAVVKRSIDRIESMLSQKNPAFLLDPHGIIFLASQPDTVMKSMWPIPDAVVPDIIASRQFGPGPFPSLFQEKPLSRDTVKLFDQTWLFSIEPSPYEGWQLAVLGSTRGMVSSRLIGIGLTLFFCLTSLGLFLVWDTTLEAAARIGVSERLYRSLVEGAPDCVSLFDREGRFLAVNPNGWRLLGRPAVDVLGLPLTHLWPPEERRPVEEAIARVAQGEKTDLEMSYQHPQGKTSGWQVILNPIQEADGRVQRFVGIITDVTERQQAQANLQQRLELEALIARISTEFINLPSEKINDGISRALETLGKFVGVDRAYVFQLHDDGRRASNTFEWCAPGITPEKPNLQGLLLDETLPWFSYLMRNFQVCCVPQVSALPEAATLEKADFVRQGIQSLVVVPMVHKENLVGFFGFDAVRTFKVWNDDTITILKMVADLLVNVLERQRAEEALAAEKDRLAVTLSSIGDAVIATDMEGNIQLMNHEAEVLTGWSQAEAVGQPALNVCRISDSRTRQACTDLIPRILAGEASSGQSNFLTSRNGRELLIAESGAPIRDQNQQVRGAVLVFRDITLKKRLEEELLKVEKLRSLGILAGGIAHDFNNILTAILGNLSLSLLYSADEEKSGPNLHKRLLEAEKATLRARDLVQQLLTFAKGGAPVKQLASLKELVEESASFAVRGSRSRCQLDLPPDLWPVEVDEGQISQVVQNLVINASQAMPQGGVITLEAANIVLDESSGLPLAPGSYVKVRIADQGLGIPAEHLPRIFDPFFSTKQHGSGLGLATVYSIVTNHGGHITVESQLGVGTSFAIFFPASPLQLERAKPSQPFLYSGWGRILVMDDEEMVREVVGRMLRQLGYDVELTADGQEALAQFQAAQVISRPFGAVILDLTVPGGMGGRETMEKLLALDPQVVGLVSSGYAEDAIMTHYQDYGFKGIIKKPYRIEEISKALHTALQGG